MSGAAYSSSTLGICVGSPSIVKDIKTPKKISKDIQLALSKAIIQVKLVYRIP